MGEDRLQRRLRESAERYAEVLERFLYPRDSGLDAAARRRLMDELRAHEAEYFAIQQVVQSDKPHGFDRVMRFDSV